MTRNTGNTDDPQPLSVPTTRNTPGTYWELTNQAFFRYRHSSRDPWRSRYRSQPNALRQRAARFLSVCVHRACAF